MSHSFLDSPDPRTRRWFVVVISIASAAAGVAWSAWGGWDALGDGEMLMVAVTLGLAACVWFVFAGIGLRLVRAVENRRTFTGQSLD